MGKQKYKGFSGCFDFFEVLYTADLNIKNYIKHKENMIFSGKNKGHMHSYRPIK